MKKLFGLLLTLLLIFTLSSCSEFSGNYRVATNEEIIDAKAKVNELSNVVDNHTYELTTSASGKVQGENINFKATRIFNYREDIVEYESFEVSISYIWFKCETWTKDNITYMNSDYKLQGSGSNIKIRGNTIDVYEESGKSLHRSLYNSYARLIRIYNITSFYGMLLDTESKVYLDGSNKIKLEGSYYATDVIAYFVIDSNNAYSMRIEAPKFQFNYEEINHVTELKPTNKKTEFPNESDYRLVTSE